MNRRQLEHLIRAASTIADDADLLIIGSQAILGSFPDAPPSLLRSMEADIVPLNEPDRADLIDGSILESGGSGRGLLRCEHQPWAPGGVGLLPQELREGEVFWPVQAQII